MIKGDLSLFTRGLKSSKDITGYYVMATTDRKDVEKALSLLVEIEKKLLK